MRNTLALTASLLLVLSFVLASGCESRAQRISRLEQRGNLDGLTKIHHPDADVAQDRLLYARIEVNRVNRVEVTLCPFKRVDEVCSVMTPQGTMQPFVSGHWKAGAEDRAGGEKIRSRLVEWLKSRQLWTDGPGGVGLEIQVWAYPTYTDSAASGALYSGQIGGTDMSDFDSGPPAQATGVYEIRHDSYTTVVLRVLVDGKSYLFGGHGRPHKLAYELEEIAKSS